ncbi:MAG TPA: aldo/keto reductase [Candidatus Kryptonia bacterium]|nr:aldo/keto reductase [Candidatus Kryptonia bacterium]
MEQRRLGRTGLPVSRLGLGLAALGRPGYINLGHAEDLQRDYDVPAMEARAHAVLDAAWAAGVRYFDAARSYGRAEQFLSTWLASRRIAPESVTVGSKWGYTYTADWRVDAARHEVKDHSLPVLTRQIAESRALLGAHLDLYQIHSATLDSGVLDDTAVLKALARLRADGLRIGLSLSGTKQPEALRRAMEIVIDGEPVFDTVQATWNLLEQSAGPALQAAHDAGIGVIVKEALANGRLTARNVDASFASSRRQLDEISARLNTTVDALALAAVVAQPWVDVVLSGAATVGQLRSNLTAVDIALAERDAAQLLALREDPTEYWRTRSQLPWN